MRDLSITINGQLVDLPATKKGLVRLTQARAALTNLDTRVGEYALPLTFPDTRPNARAFGVEKLHPQGVGKFVTVDYAYELRCEGQVLRGTFRLSSLKGGYTGQLLGAGFSWALELGSKLLTDLRFPAIAYDGSQLPAILDKDCDSTDAQFPLISFGNYFHPPIQVQQPDGSYEEGPAPPAAVLDYPLSVDDYPPGVYYVNVLKQIFKEIGWSLSGRVLDEGQWRQTVLTCAGADVEAAWPWGALIPASGTATGSTQYSYYNAAPSGVSDLYTNTAVGFDEDALAGNIDGLDLGGEVFFLPVPVPIIGSGGTRALDGLTASITAPRAGTYTLPFSVELVNGHQTIIIAHPLTPPTTNQRDPMTRVRLGIVVRRGGEGYPGSVVGGSTPDPLVFPVFVELASSFDGSGNVIAGTKTGTCDVYLEAGDVASLVVVARRRLIDVGIQPNDTKLTRSEFVLNFGACSFGCSAYVDNDGVSSTMLQPSLMLPPLGQKELVGDFLRRTNSVMFADAGRRVAHILSREELTTAAGSSIIDLSPLIDPDTISYTPTFGAGVGALVFNPAANEDPLLAPNSDVVRVGIGPGETEQTVAGLFAPMAYRNYRLKLTEADAGVVVSIPTATDQSGLDADRSDTAWDRSSAAPRLVRYTGPHPTLTIPFGAGTAPLATSAWDGALAWAGTAGAVATYYADTIRKGLRGHLAIMQAALSPALYQQLTPGRRVYVLGACYTVEQVSSFDLVSDDTTEIQLLREV